MRRGVRSRRRGFALMAVLWILVLVGAAAVSLHATTRTERRATANALDAARGRWAARAGLAALLVEVDRSRGGAGGLLDTLRGDTVAGPLLVDVGIVPTRAVAIDPRARLNPNHAGADRLVRLFDAVGVPAPDRLTEAILMRRRQAERPDPRDAAESQTDGPRPAFLSLDELHRLPGVDRASVAAALPFLTVIGDGRVNVNTAPTPVLLTLAGVDDQLAALIEARRSRRPFRDAYEVLRAIPSRQRSGFESRIHTFAEEAAFSVAQLELRVEAGTEGVPLRSSLDGVLALSSGAGWELLRVTESNR